MPKQTTIRVDQPFDAHTYIDCPYCRKPMGHPKPTNDPCYPWAKVCEKCDVEVLYKISPAETPKPQKSRKDHAPNGS